MLNSLSARVGELKYLKSLFHITRSALKIRPSFPALVELQTVNRCNAGCSMCPYPHTIAEQPLTYMSDVVYLELLEQLAQESEFKMLVLSFQNEPLVDKKLLKRARLFKQAMPDKHLEIVTNGTLLTPDKAEQLYQAFDLISISVNAHSSQTYRNVMGMDSFNSLTANLKFIARHPEWVNKTVLRFIRQQQNRHERGKFVRYWRQYGFRTFSFDINNRLDAVNNHRQIRCRRDWIEMIRLALYRPLSRLLLPHCTIADLTTYIRANGDVVLCFNDYSDDHILGSISSSSIRDIYNSDRVLALRERIRLNQVADGEICNKCDLYKEGIWLTF